MREIGGALALLVIAAIAIGLYYSWAVLLMSSATVLAFVGGGRHLWRESRMRHVRDIDPPEATGIELSADEAAYVSLVKEEMQRREGAKQAMCDDIARLRERLNEMHKNRLQIGDSSPNARRRSDQLFDERSGLGERLNKMLLEIGRLKSSARNLEEAVRRPLPSLGDVDVVTERPMARRRHYEEERMKPYLSLIEKSQKLDRKRRAGRGGMAVALLVFALIAFVIGLSESLSNFVKVFNRSVYLPVPLWMPWLYPAFVVGVFSGWWAYRMLRPKG